MKIGIFTFHNAYNYGAVLQAYALKESLLKFNKEVFVVDYRQKEIENAYRILPYEYKNNKKYIGINSLKQFIYKIPNLKKIIKKKNKFNKFTNEYLNLTNKTYFNNYELKELEIDVAIFGSDQIWNPKVTGGFDGVYFGYFENRCKKVSYAASIGNSDLDNQNIKILNEYIENLDSISIREKQIKNILNNKKKDKVLHVLDPTLLLDEKKWSDISVSPKIKDKYILIYQLGNNNELNKIANELSSKLNLSIIDISGKYCKYTKNYICLNDISPNEFVGLFKCASFIITDSFHGTSFSIIYKKNFYVVPNIERSERIKSLLESLKLTDRIIYSINELNKNNHSINYNDAYNILNIEKQKSIKFLKEAINE